MKKVPWFFKLKFWAGGQAGLWQETPHHGDSAPSWWPQCTGADSAAPPHTRHPLQTCKQCLGQVAYFITVHSGSVCESRKDVKLSVNQKLKPILYDGWSGFLFLPLYQRTEQTHSSRVRHCSGGSRTEGQDRFMLPYKTFSLNQLSKMDGKNAGVLRTRPKLHMSGSGLGSA